jgi:phosphoribosylanthranilate isomerase
MTMSSPPWPRPQSEVLCWQGKAIVDAVRSFGERAGRVLPWRADLGAGAGAGVEAGSPGWFAAWQRSLLRVTRRSPLTVGVFQNQPLEEVLALAQGAGVDLVQLHGDEDAAFARAVAEGAGVPCVKVLHVPAAGSDSAAKAQAVLAEIRAAGPGPVALLLDTSVAGSKGGSGVAFDWAVARRVQDEGYPVLVAGGLSPENVVEAVRAVRPFGVDVSGGVEDTPGVKDHQKVSAFLTNVRGLETLEQEG